MIEVALSHRVWRAVSAIWRAFNWLMVGSTACVVLLLANTAAHTWLGVCPTHFATFTAKSLIPVRYGYPTADLLYRAAQGKAVMGGCVPGLTSGVCPYCRWPAQFKRH